MALNLLVDTCVWLDLAKDYRQQPVISVLEDLVKGNQVSLVIPQLVIDEFQGNKARIIEETRRSLQSHLRVIREAVNRFADDNAKTKTLQTLEEVDHTAVTKGGAVTDSVERIERLLASSRPIAASSKVKQRVTDRALAKLAPCHRSKNNIADAILLELYAETLEKSEGQQTTFAFVTHNTNDFSDPNGDRRLPHPELASLFDSAKSTYATSIVDVIKSVSSELLDDYHAEFNFSQQPRTLSEILEEENLLFRKVWYNRHWNLRPSIKDGKKKVVSKENYSTDPYKPDEILDTVWAQALKAAKKTEKEIGLENLGPWDDFEWGMLNGKLSALRWVLGDEWDMLDT